KRPPRRGFAPASPLWGGPLRVKPQTIEVRFDHGTIGSTERHDAPPARRVRARARALPARDLLPQLRSPEPRARARTRTRAVRRQPRQRAGRPDRARGAVAARAALPG